MSDLLSLHRRNPWSIGAKQALTSVLAHGVTSTPLTRLFGRGRPARPDEDHHEGERSGTRP